nr:ATP-binding protein [Streptomyces triticisoli]
MEERSSLLAPDVSCTVALAVGELAASAVQQGRVPGCDFGLRLALDAAAGLVRIEAADATTAKRSSAAPPCSYPEWAWSRTAPVGALTVRWGSEPRRPVSEMAWVGASVRRQVA